MAQITDSQRTAIVTRLLSDDELLLAVGMLFDDKMQFHLKRAHRAALEEEPQQAVIVQHHAKAEAFGSIVRILQTCNSPEPEEE